MNWLLFTRFTLMLVLWMGLGTMSEFTHSPVASIDSLTMYTYLLFIRIQHSRRFVFVTCSL